VGNPGELAPQGGKRRTSPPHALTRPFGVGEAAEGKEPDPRSECFARSEEPANVLAPGGIPAAVRAWKPRGEAGKVRQGNAGVHPWAVSVIPSGGARIPHRPRGRGSRRGDDVDDGDERGKPGVSTAARCARAEAEPQTQGRRCRRWKKRKRFVGARGRHKMWRAREPLLAFGARPDSSTRLRVATKKVRRPLRAARTDAGSSTSSFDPDGGRRLIARKPQVTRGSAARPWLSTAIDKSVSKPGDPPTGPSREVGARSRSAWASSAERLRTSWAANAGARLNLTPSRGPGMARTAEGSSPLSFFSF